MLFVSRTACEDAWFRAIPVSYTHLDVYKRQEEHKAAVIGDTVGDPFKDTSGPSINILIKLTSMVSIVFAGLIVAVHLL